MGMPYDRLEVVFPDGTTYTGPMRLRTDGPRWMLERGKGEEPVTDDMELWQNGVRFWPLPQPYGTLGP